MRSTSPRVTNSFPPTRTFEPVSGVVPPPHDTNGTFQELASPGQLLTFSAEVGGPGMSAT